MISGARIAILASLVAAAAGCQSKPIQQMSYSETKALALELHKRCAAEGAPQGSPEFDACMQQEVNREVATRQANADARQRLAAGLANVGANMQRNAARRPINCTSTPGYGGAVSTSCY
jgi:hypothetical protein